MPDEPNRSLKEQLTAWARKRREEAGAPFELHPVTRKMLQDEVARTFPKKSDEPAAGPAGWWKMFWPRFALAGSICVALVGVVGILLPGLAKSKSKGQQIALVRQQEKALSADSERRDASSQVVPGRSRAVEAPVDHFGDEAAKTRAPESQPPAAPSLAENKPLEQEAIVHAEPKDARLKPEQPAKVEERQFSEKSKQLILYAAVRPTSSTRRFGQVREYRTNFNSPPMPNVLSSFQLEQNGRLIRVVDADGSIYDGAIEQPPTEEAARRGIAVQTAATDLKKNIEPEAKRVEGLAAASADEIAALRNVFFRVAGTNRTLNQLVVFEGNFLARTNQANQIVLGAKLTADQSATATGRQSLSQKAQQTPSGLIRGQATIGLSNRIEINAAPVSE